MAKAKVKKAPVKKAAPGTRFSKRIQNAICAYLVRGLSVELICKKEQMPSVKTYYQWRKTKDEFREETDKAKVDGCDAIAEEIFSIADDSRNDYMEVYDKETGDTKRVVDREVVARSKLRVDARTWYLSKIMPAKYGDRLEVKHEASDDLAAMLKAGRERAHNRH